MKRIFNQSLIRRRGLTFIEVMVSVGIISFVMIFLVYITLLQGLKSNRIATISRAETDVRNVAEFIRYRMIMGRFGSVNISNNGQTLTFNDPNNGAATSSFTFNSNSGQLVYDNDIADNDTFRTFQRLQSCTFTALNNGSVVEVALTALATPYSTESPRPSLTIEQKMKVYLRN